MKKMLLPINVPVNLNYVKKIRKRLWDFGITYIKNNFLFSLQIIKDLLPHSNIYLHLRLNYKQKYKGIRLSKT